jgi:glycerate 2-kinase
LLVATGKAAATMARGADAGVRGYVLLPRSADASHLADGLEVLRADHPVPSPAGVAASARILAAVATLGAGKRILYLVSGGTSALFEVPRTGIDVQSLIAAHRALLASGAPIHEMNVVRRALSAVKGGGFARAARGANLLTLAVSDVADDDPLTIGSGPTVESADDPSAARAVLERYGLWEGVALDVRSALTRTPKRSEPAPSGSRYEVVCSIETAVEASRSALVARGYSTEPAGPLDGDAMAAAERLSRRITRALDVDEQRAVVVGGETTVRLTAAAGRGGRNHHVAAALALALAGRGGFACVVGGTDGIDGNTDCAGALVDGGTAAGAARAGFPLARALERFDTGSALAAAGAALRTGATGTNVGDLVVAVTAACR